MTRKISKPLVSNRRALVFTVEFDREEDGRWIADIPGLPGVMVYGRSKADVLVKVQAFAYRVLADKIERERAPQTEVRFACA
jgi:predicted RNase H-like HicB family nuclease